MSCFIYTYFNVVIWSQIYNILSYTSVSFFSFFFEHLLCRMSPYMYKYLSLSKLLLSKFNNQIKISNKTFTT